MSRSSRRRDGDPSDRLPQSGPDSGGMSAGEEPLGETFEHEGDLESDNCHWLNRDEAGDAGEPVGETDYSWLEGRGSGEAEPLPALAHSLEPKETLSQEAGVEFGDWAPASDPDLAQYSIRPSPVRRPEAEQEQEVESSPSKKSIDLGQALSILPCAGDGDGFAGRQLVLQGIRVDDGGVPILEDEVQVDGALDILVQELRQELPALVQDAFVAAVKQVALDLKHNFEQRLAQLLDERLDELVTAAMNKADPDSRVD